jgi:hypothetical protein
LNSQALTDSASALIPSNPAGRGYLPPEPNLAGDGGPVGPIAEIPVYLDGGITTTAGGGANQDVIVLTRPSDHLLFESTPNVSVNLEPLCGTMQARIRLGGAVIAHRPCSTAAERGRSSCAMLKGPPTASRRHGLQVRCVSWRAPAPSWLLFPE